ncbi:hypothetical protein VTN31DRAFT_1718 [Thermomyces dupontii]|uniref:uncharacterized protein n=1 Tax=Talaromyces thermophilus TaxID=28565 RepID=UPI003742FDDE
MATKQIPGFYFDPVKKKYFRIQADNVAPAGSQYSASAVKKRKVETERVEHEQRIQERVRKERVVKAKCFTNARSRLLTEIGSSCRPGFVMKSEQSSVFAAQLQRYEVLKFDKHPNDLKNVMDFARQESTGIAIMGGNRLAGSGIIACPPVASSGDRWSYDIDNASIHYNIPHELSSVTLGDRGHFVATLHGDVSGQSFIALGRLPEGSIDYPWHTERVPRLSQIKDTATLWCSAARPQSDESMFAIGTSEGLYTVRSNQAQWHLNRKPFAYAEAARHGARKQKRFSDTLAVEWLGQNVIASGQRNSSINLGDLRSGGQVTRLQHPHSVRQIRKVDEYRIVVAGYQSLQMYDLRLPQNGMQSRPRPEKQRQHTSTKPYLVFDDHHNDSHAQRIDLNPEMGVLASVTDQNSVKLHSLTDGKVIPSSMSAHRYPLPIASLRFENGPYPAGHWQSPRIVVSCGRVLEEWTC